MGDQFNKLSSLNITEFYAVHTKDHINRFTDDDIEPYPCYAGEC